MVNKHYQILWDTVALVQFKEIFVYIRKDSYQNALKVKNRIVKCVDNLKSEPRRYKPDQFRLDGDKAFRSFEVYNIRITYFIDDANLKVNIIRVWSTKQEPLTY
ncbi:type II toxin-antitoxin system RelE/ParE family toxin [Dyadobacter fermentans]|uniref:Plasmid stabilization system n=1 Tax=Dyadobacter fermentans (strain ATCC 700827 / DSM 18053 / CIP 107007 / KCTC 52180 / NS114) TaxID=471854 RepID=C6W5V8_DYAFD|nr:type II toxin-antitoxin system RelE/ParE family toxin [Dyadobacter fermentans]ACT96047.1 plasmid stabilization system [Dyadobacter fermentans DSM 18053]